jgi:dolichyl-phosphate-mannose-protein mannosyltransferase
LVGAFLGLASSVKFVGLFSVVLIGIFTVKELWDMVCNPAVSLKSLFRHFMARFACLIVLPVIIYMSIYFYHFKMISKVGSDIGSTQMSPSFIVALGGKKVVPDTFKRIYIYLFLEVAYGSKVYLRHDATAGGYLHSHNHFYPTGSKQQQVTCYGFKDDNSLFEILLPLRADNGTVVEDPVEGFNRVKDGDTIRLKHVPTGKKLHSHNVR